MDIYRHDNFRLVLAELWRELRAREPNITTRAFAARAGFSNPGYLGDVIQGRRGLSTQAREKMIRGFGLDEGQAAFFRLLVAHDQERDPTAREAAWKALCARRGRSGFARLNPRLARYYQDWRYPMLRAATLAHPVAEDDAASLAGFLDPPLATAEARRLLEDLRDWGLLHRRPDGRLEATDAFVEPPPTMARSVRRLQRTWIEQAACAVDRLPPHRRHASTMIISMSREAEVRLKALVESFREEVFEILRQDAQPADRVAQLSIQFLPRSNSPEDR